MEELMRLGHYTIYVYAIGGYCVYHDDFDKRVYHSKTLWESVKYVEDMLNK